MSAPAPTEIGAVFQVAYAVADREQGKEALECSLGLTGWIEFEAGLSVDPEHGGGEAQVAVAFARWGRVVVEVLQPVGGAVDTFREALDPGGAPRLHHLGLRVEDLARAREQLQAAGAACALSGGFADQLRFAFLDTRAQLGHHLELVEFSAEGWQLMAGILAADG